MTRIPVDLDVEGETDRPVCPHCGKELSELQMTVGMAQVSSMVSLVIDTFCCPACRKVLSVAGRM